MKSTYTFKIFLLFFHFIFLQSAYSQICDCSDELNTVTTVVSSDGFESYTLGNPMPSAGPWSVFPSVPSQNYFPVAGTIVNNPTYCGSKSLRFQYVNGIPQDMNYDYEGDRISFRLNVPNTKSAKFAYLDGGFDTVFELLFGTGNTGTFDGQSFSYSHNTWIRVSIINENGTYYLFINDNNVASTTNSIQPNYFNLFANQTDNQFYVDKMCHTNITGFITCNALFDPVCLNQSSIEVGANACYALQGGFLDTEFSQCNSGGSGACDNATPINCGTTITSSTIGETYKFYRPDYSACLVNNNANDFQAPDKVFEFFHPGGDVGIHLWGKTQGIDLDVFLLDECGSAWSGTPWVIVTVPPGTLPNTNINCIAAGVSTVDLNNLDNDFIYVENLASGTYYIVVDGQFPTSVGNFDLSLTCGELNCNNATEILCNNPLNNQSNSNGQNNISVYCNPAPQGSGSTNPIPMGTGCTGKERVYKYLATQTGDVTVNVTGIDANEDFDVFVIEECDPTVCIAKATNSFGIIEQVTFPAQQGATYQIVVDGYKGTQGSFNIEINCGDYCLDCGDCFSYIPRYNAPRTCNFYNRYCEPIGTRSESSETFTYTWSVPNASVTYSQGSSTSSQNPIIIFPTDGTYTVCQKVFNNGVLLFECCQVITVGPCNNGPIAYYTTTSSNNKFTLNSSQSQNVSNFKWEFSQPVTFVDGTNENSSNPVITIPNNQCVTVCFNASNGCGVSRYCNTICFNNSSCTPNIPPVYFASPIVPVINNQMVTINLPQNANAQYKWNFGDGKTSTSQNGVHTYTNYGYYIVCVEVRIGCRVYCYCWCVHVKDCQVVTTRNNQIIPRYLGPEPSFKYSFTCGLTFDPTRSWRVNNNNVSGTANNLTYTFPSSGTYTVCYPYIKADGCPAFECIDINVGNPFNCNVISWKFINGNYHFEIPSSNTNASWTIDEDNLSIGTGNISAPVAPLPNCGWKTISVRYFDGTKWWICCLRIYLCSRDFCYTNIVYGSSNNQAQFTLQESGATNVSWYFDDAPSVTLGSSSSIVLPYPTNCTSRWISVKFRDANGRWRVCCRLIYFCNPFNCNNISMRFDPFFGRYIFDLNETGAQDVKWTLDDTGEELGAFLPIPPLGQCKVRPVSVRYFKPGVGWVICCMNFYHCHPLDCSSTITAQNNGNNTILSIPSNFTNITWFNNLTQIATGNNASVPLLSGSATICVRYYNAVTKSWYFCCRDFNGGGSSTNLIVDIDDNVCGSLGSIIKVPVRVKNFKNVSSYQFTIRLQNTNHASIMSIEKENYAGILESNKNSDGSYGIIWDHTSEISLDDNSILLYVHLQLNTTLTSPSGMVIANDPVAINFSSLSSTIPHNVLDGSYCTSGSGKLCGKITKEDNASISNVTVTLTGGNLNKASTTDVNGNYCFEDVPLGQTYTITPKKDINYKNGLFSSDIVAMRRHILGLAKLNSPYKIYASDVVNDGKTVSSDVVDLRRLILNLITDFPTRNSWEFIPKGFVFQDPTKPFNTTIPNTIDLNFNAQNLSVDFIGVKMGDVDNSANGNQLNQIYTDTRNAVDLGLIVGNALVGINQEFEIPIKATNFTDLLSGQFSINWDKTKADFVSISYLNPLLQLTFESNFNATVNGEVGFIWDATSALSLPENDILFTLKLKSKSTLANNVVVDITDQPVAKNFQAANGSTVNINVVKGGFTVPTNESTIDDIKIYPNPSNSHLQIESDTPIQSSSLYDITGKQVLTETTESKIDMTKFISGIYILKVKTSKGISQFKVFRTE